MFLAPLSVAAAMLPVVGPFLVHDSERVTFNGASLVVEGDEDVELTDALAALTGAVAIGDASAVFTVAGSIRPAVINLADIQTSDGTINTAWVDTVTVKKST